MPLQAGQTSISTPSRLAAVSSARQLGHFMLFSLLAGASGQQVSAWGCGHKRRDDRLQSLSPTLMASQADAAEAPRKTSRTRTAMATSIWLHPDGRHDEPAIQNNC